MSRQPARPTPDRPAQDTLRNAKSAAHVERLASEVIGASIRIHKLLGPGLLESVYESILARDLECRGLHVDRQCSVPIECEGLSFDEGFRCDLLVEGTLVIEIKSVKSIAPVHLKQVLSYIRLLRVSLGLLINFGAPTIKEGCRRVVDQHPNTGRVR